LSCSHESSNYQFLSGYFRQPDTGWTAHNKKNLPTLQQNPLNARQGRALKSAVTFQGFALKILLPGEFPIAAGSSPDEIVPDDIDRAL
jgi:hypothetical protein